MNNPLVSTSICYKISLYLNEQFHHLLYKITLKWEILPHREVFYGIFPQLYNLHAYFWQLKPPLNCSCFPNDTIIYIQLVLLTVAVPRSPVEGAHRLPVWLCFEKCVCKNWNPWGMGWWPMGWIRQWLSICSLQWHNFSCVINN